MATSAAQEIKSADVTERELVELEVLVETEIGDDTPLGEFLIGMIGALRSGHDLTLLAT